MTERIVHFLEAIEVHQQQSDEGLLGAGCLQRLLQALEQQDPIRQIGQDIVHGLMAKHHELVLAVGDVAQKGDPVRQLAAFIDRHELQLQLEFGFILAPNSHIGFEGVAIEDMVEQRVEDGLLPLDDPQNYEGLADDLFPRPAVQRAEAVIDESHSRAGGLDRRGENGNPLPGHANGAAEEAELIAGETVVANVFVLRSHGECVDDTAMRA